MSKVCLCKAIDENMFLPEFCIQQILGKRYRIQFNDLHAEGFFQTLYICAVLFNTMTCRINGYLVMES